MKKITFLWIGLLLIILTQVNAQIEFKKPVSANTTYTKKVIYTAPEKLLVERFNINFITSGWVAQGSITDGVGIAAFLNLDEQLAQDIVDESYNYLKEQFKDNGYEMSVYSMPDVEANKTYQKMLKKEKVAVRNGGIEVETTKMASKGDSKVSAAANEVIQVTFNSLGSESVMFGLAMVPMGTSCVLSFDLTIGFLETKTGNSTMFNSVSITPYLSLINAGDTRKISHYDKKGKLAMVLFGNNDIKYTGAGWISEKEETKELYGSSYKYNLNKEAYKKACLEMTKAYIDQMITAFNEERTDK